MNTSANRKVLSFRRFISSRGFLVLLVIVFGVSGCQSGGTTKREDGGNTLEDALNKGKFRGREVRIQEGELRQVRRTVADLMKQFSSDRPRDWRATAREIKKLGDDFLPEILKERLERAQETGPEGKRARKQLVRWGTLKSIVLQLPSRDPQQWDTVRKKMLAYGSVGQEMFIMHMLDYLKKPDPNQNQAARQLAKISPDVVDNAWEKIKSLALKARRATERGKSIKGAMIILQGLSQVQVYAGRWQRIRDALQHKSIRIRMAMAQALGQAGQVERATTLLGHVVRQDPQFRVRHTAVKALGVFDRKKEPIAPLADALKDPKTQVAKSAADALRYFHNHEQTVVRAMINVLGQLQETPDRAAHRRIIHKTLQKITKEKSVGNSYREWAAWYRIEYDRAR